MLLRTFCWLTVMIAVSAPAAQRPRIVGIANIAVKVDNLDEARKFYSGVVGMAEAFQTRDAAVTGELACFKVNDRQYVEVSPTLKSETEDRLIRIGFETNDARELRNYLAGKGVKVPPYADKDANGNRSFVVMDPRSEDRLIRIGFETNDARELRNYLAGKGVKVPPYADKDANGNRSFVVMDP